MISTNLCPICGESIRLTGTTTDNRLIGSCGDAFTIAQWTEDSHGFGPVAMHAGHFAGYTITGHVHEIKDNGYEPSGEWRFVIRGKPWMERLGNGEKSARREYHDERTALVELALALVAIDELRRERAYEPISAY